ncbi:hypothetical protein [Anaeromyxobacter oryzae]|uniref:Acyltransferase 3 domain-containing protein n=1 Tax=Anaeromyxobacter oryzae TaxID=2918170 RepID=A0ABM7WYN8_9BACT|nr:hypothetical protein [Anaeromyxobacter oryzae]BDG04642.1 hypothetical protein AMOR_36380 [Anaeromyxobacter oryzae]
MSVPIARAAADPPPEPEPLPRPALVQATAPGMPGIDLLRLLAVAAIAWFHAGGPFSEYLGFRLPAVALVTSLVVSRSARWAPRRVLVPWAIWYAVYLAALLFRLREQSWGGAAELRWHQLLLSGPAPHLWYAPFALMAGWLVTRFASAATGWILGAVALASAVAVAMRGLPYPGPQWGMVLPAIPAGMLLARKDAPRWALLALVAATTAALGLRYAIAVALVLGVSRWEGPRLRRLAEVGRGVYWSHVLVILLLHKLGTSNPVVALAGAGAAALGLSATPWGRRAL